MITPSEMKQQRVILTAGYDDFKKVLARYATMKTSNSDLAEDLIQNTFLKTWKYLVKGGRVDMMEAFLFHILKALIIDEYRKPKSTSLEALLEKGFSPSSDTTDRLIDTIDGRLLVALIAKLPPLYRKPMRLRYVKELSLAEISLITGQSRNTVAVQTHRGLAKLKVLYASQPSVIRSRRSGEHKQRIL